MIEHRPKDGGRESGVWVRVAVPLVYGAILTIASCSTVPGRFTQWQITPSEIRGESSSVQVYTLQYDSVADHLRLNERLEPHDTIGIIVHEPKLLADFEKREEFWTEDQRVIESLQERAWEMGGDIILVGTPEMGRRGLRKMLHRFVNHESRGNEKSEQLEEIEEFTKNPWVAHIAYVLRSTG